MQVPSFSFWFFFFFLPPVPRRACRAAVGESHGMWGTVTHRHHYHFFSSLSFHSHMDNRLPPVQGQFYIISKAFILLFQRNSISGD